MKLLISGASGLLGKAIQRQAQKMNITCVNLDRAKISLGLAVSDILKVDELFEGVDHFVHAAANTDVEHCELEPASCYRDNVLLTELLANAARRKGVLMTYISSVGVYGSAQKIPWAEYDEARPVTHHHRSKLIGEQLVMAANSLNSVTRTGWLYGGELKANKNFVTKRIEEARSSTSGFIFSNNQQRGCPTNVDDAAERILDIIMLRASGLFNVVNTGSASRLEYVAAIVGSCGLNVEIRPYEAGDFKRIAPVSDNEMAINWRADMHGLPSMRYWRDALVDYLKVSKLLETPE
jgi:dTDP-4-dehydrorhamnose reductase